MDFGVKQLKLEFQEHKHNAQMYNPAALPIINELEYIAIQRVVGKMSSSKARSKIKSCCLKVGINPMGIERPMIKPTNLFKPMKNNKSSFKSVNLFKPKKMTEKQFYASDQHFNTEQSYSDYMKPMKNHKPLKFKHVNLFADKKANNPRVRRRSLGINLPSIFPASSSFPKKKQQFPAFNLEVKKQKGKVKQLEFKPISFGQPIKRSNKRSNKGFKIKPIKFGKWF